MALAFGQIILTLVNNYLKLNEQNCNNPKTDLKETKGYSVSLNRGISNILA
jgi:hypothetical protein